MDERGTQLVVVAAVGLHAGDGGGGRAKACGVAVVAVAASSSPLSSSALRVVSMVVPVGGGARAAEAGGIQIWIGTG